MKEPARFSTVGSKILIKPLPKKVQLRERTYKPKTEYLTANRRKNTHRDKKEGRTSRASAGKNFLYQLLAREKRMGFSG